jgi:large subunit ribosomal protein L30
VSDLFAVVRIRGSVNLKGETKDTLAMLRLNRVNHCVLVPATPHYIGMLKKVHSWITWGEVDQKSLAVLLEKRGRLVGGKPIDEKALKKMGFDSFDKLAEALAKGKSSVKELDGIKPVFRLNPPVKGFKSTRSPYPKGDLGYRKKAINDLLKRMI